MDIHPFQLGKVYKRTEIHEKFGGNGRGGISTTARFPYILIFSVPTGNNHGYKDRWENEDVYSYTGEGQEGDMQIVRNNLQLLEHKSKGKRVFLFVGSKKAHVQFQGELELIDADVFKSLDKNGNYRNAIKFFFKRANKELEYDLSIQKDLLSAQLLLKQNDEPLVTEREGLITSRVGQGAYRKSLLHRWKYKCAVTHFDKKEILIASHIVPWKISNNNERLDVHNGILLSPTYDALFDQKLISFENSGKIILSDLLLRSNYSRIGVTGKEIIKDFSSDNHTYLERHRSFLLS